MNQKGFVNIILIAIIIAATAVGGYFVFVKKSEPVAQQPTPAPTQTNTPTKTSAPTQTPKVETTKKPEISSATPPTQETSQQNQAPQKTPTSQNAGFIADVSGARTATIKGPGIFFCIPAYEYAPGHVQQSDLVVSSNRGVREDGIVFTIPRGKPSGTYKLAANYDPFANGTAFDVRAELGSTVDYFNKNTNGTLTIDSIPEGAQNGTKSPLRGSFDFSTSNKEGELVKIKGSFDFPAPQDKIEYCKK